MKIQSVFDDAFRTYGRVVDSYDYSLLLERLEANTPKPADSVVYVPSVAELEDTPATHSFAITATVVCRSRSVTAMEPTRN